jgi:DNA-binding transcriptional MerR regulator
MAVSFTVNDLAMRVGIHAHVVRYYTQRGFLTPTRNARNDYREYRESDLRRLRFICGAKALGFTLQEIGLILQVADGYVAPGRQAADLVLARVRSIERSIENAQRSQRRIREVVSGWSAASDAAAIPRNLQSFIDAVALEE